MKGFWFSAHGDLEKSFTQHDFNNIPTQYKLSLSLTEILSILAGFHFSGVFFFLNVLFTTMMLSCTLCIIIKDFLFPVLSYFYRDFFGGFLWGRDDAALLSIFSSLLSIVYILGDSYFIIESLTTPPQYI